MADYYALPESAANGWPGRAKSRNQLNKHKAEYVEKALKNDMPKLSKRVSEKANLRYESAR